MKNDKNEKKKVESSSRNGKSSGESSDESAWLDTLITNATKICHDAGHHQNEFQIDIEEELALEGNKFFINNFFMSIVNMFIGLYSILYIPNIARILDITGRSGSTELSFQRYLSTLTHSIKWFQGTDDLKLSLKQVLNLHRAGSFQGQKEGVDKTGSKQISKGITQFDMVITQWGFIGPALVFNNIIPFYPQGESENGFIYVMYLVGKSLGVLDQYNLCYGTTQQTKQRCHLILKQVIQPCLQKRDELSEDMTFHLLNGINILNPLIIQSDFKLFLEKLLLQEPLEVENSSTIYSLYLFFFQKIMRMPGISILRIIINNLLMYNIWLADKWSLTIMQFNDKYVIGRFNNTIIQLIRFCQIMNIPIFSVISISAHFFRKFRSSSLRSKIMGASIGCVLALVIFRH